MDTRISMQSVYQNALIDTRQITEQLAALQAQASTGQKFSKVSDNPAASLTLLTSIDQDQRLSAHLDNVQAATTALDTSVSALQSVSGIFTQAKSIAIQASNATNSPASLTALANEVSGLINDLL